MSEDFLKRYNEPIALLKTLMEIQEILLAHELNCASFNLHNPGLIDDINFDGYDTELQKLKTKEKLMLQMMKDRYFSVDLCGSGGSGKTYLYNCLMSYIRAQGQITMPFATTEIAELLLDCGRTVHSGFKLPVPILKTSVADIRLNSLQAKKFKQSKLIFIDQAIMMSCHALHCIDRFLKEVMDNNLPFGGKVMLLGGDFRPFVFQKRQFPVIMAFAMTINKSQGQTFKSVGIFLQEPVFAHGQLYVPFSRCTNPDKIKVSVEDNPSQGDLLHNGCIFTKDIVYYEVL